MNQTNLPSFPRGREQDPCRQVFRALSIPAQEDVWLGELYRVLCDRLFPEGAQRMTLTAQQQSYLDALECALQQAPQTDLLSTLLPFDRIHLEQSRVRAQYLRFEEEVAQSHVMALMRIGRAIQPFDPASHTIGVHNVALHTAILAKKAGFPVDLPLVSAAALGHDIGKFGCRGEEAKRVPYLHYYYTWQWFAEHGMEAIGHISANHSTWDLEFENLPMESLLLILADFRVRGEWDESGRERIRICTLDDAYAIICGKLADMTPDKLRRYQRVYNKLHDFEELLRSRGVSTDLTADALLPTQERQPALLGAEESLRELRNLTLEGDIRLMSAITTDQSLGQILEHIRSEKNSQHIRIYLQLLEEYSTYMTKANKQKTLVLLYELLMHPDGDVRRTAGAIMGQILANSGPKYRKERPSSAKKEYMTPAMSALLDESVELWAEYIRHCIHPERKISGKHALRIANSLKVICLSLFTSCEEKMRPRLLEPLLQQVMHCAPEDQFVLVDTLRQLPCRYLPEDAWLPLFDRLGAMLARGTLPLCTIVLDYLQDLYAQMPQYREKILQTAAQCQSTEPVLRYLGQRLRREPIPLLTESEISDLHLSNLKNAVHWSVKLTQIEMLLNSTEKSSEKFHTALHLSNLLSVSEHLPVREAAGEHLLFLATQLTTDQVNEIVIDLMRELGTGQEQISRFIPRYLGRLICLLPEKEWQENVDYLDELLHGAAVLPAQMALYTLGETLNALPADHAPQIQRMIDLIMMGIAHYKDVIHQTALRVLCRDVFARETLSMERKHDIFVRLHKKLLTILSEPRKGNLAAFNRSAMLNYLYRYITEQEVCNGPFRFPPQRPAAFFPGTFDPFSSGHRQIVQEIHSRGFEVYLAVDEFSWSKKTLPKLLRRQIVSLSVADIPNTYLFPDSIPVNIAVPEDLAALKQLLPGDTFYLVAGSDVIFNASAYRSEAEDGAATYNHIIFCRNTDPENEERLKEILRGETCLLKLPSFYDSVSSTRIRQMIDEKMDISMLVDPVVQSLIYERGLYVRSPEMKPELQQQDLYYRRYTAPADELPEEANHLLTRSSGQVAALYARPQSCLGWVAGHTVSLDGLYELLGSVEAANRVRRRASGRLLYIDQIMDLDSSETIRRLLNELLARSLPEGVTYALCRCGANPPLQEALSQLGFTPVAGVEDLYCVDMRSPVMLLQDVLLQFKPPHRDFDGVRQAVDKTRPRLRTVLNRMFPGQLLLCFDSETLNQSLVEHVTALNGVTDVPKGQRRLGPYMCVPYGKIISDEIVPNTVTKTLHVEKCFASDIHHFSIEEYPNYSPLRNQVRTLRSFRRPILLIDDLLHKGYRIHALDRVLREEQVETAKILVAVMSGCGYDLMRQQGRDVECEYYIPNLHYWLTESLLYPFLGGDSVAGREVDGHILPSANMILPYFYPYFFTDVAQARIYDLSKTALENAREILYALEQEHQSVFSTELTVRTLGEALKQPRLPDQSACMRYDMTLPASTYLTENITRLDRIWRKEE